MNLQNASIGVGSSLRSMRRVAGLGSLVLLLAGSLRAQWNAPSGIDQVAVSNGSSEAGNWNGDTGEHQEYGTDSNGDYMKRWIEYRNNTGTVITAYIRENPIYLDNPQRYDGYPDSIIANIAPGETFWIMGEYGYTDGYEFRWISDYTSQGPPPSPPTVSLSVSPGSMNWPGGMVTLNWSSTNATNVDGTSGFSTGDVNGSTQVSVGPNNDYTTSLTYTFSISVSNSAGSASDTQTVTLDHKLKTDVSFSFDPTSFTYNGGSQGPNIATNPGGATYDIVGTASATDAGNYSFDVVANGNYQGSNHCDWSIGPKGVSFSFSNTTQQYDGGTKSASVSCSDPGAPFDSSLSGGPNIGDYGISAWTTSSNYTGSGSDTLHITPKPVSFSFSNLNYDYDGSGKSASVSCSEPSASFDSSLGGGPDAGVYGVWANATGNYSGSGSDTLTINPKSVSFSFSNLSHEYDGSTKSANVSVNDGSAPYSTDLTKGPDAGSYTVSAWTTSNNYTGSGSDTLTINAKPVSFSFSNLDFTYDGASHSASVTPSDSSASYSSDLTKGPNAGTYTVSATANGNYSGSDSATLTIAAASQTVSISPTSQTIQAGNSITFTASGGNNGYTWGGSASGTGTTKTVSFPSVGTYSVTVTSPAGGNYAQSNTATATITVNPAGIATTFSFAPTTFTYNGSAQGPAVSTNPVDATYTTTGATATNAGNYTITATATTPYLGTGSSGYSIAKATPTITWNAPAPITYGTALSATQLNTTANVPGTFAYSPAAGTILAVGNQTLSVTFTPTDSSNYNSASKSVTLTVNAAPVTFSFNPTTFTYTGSAQGPTITSSVPAATYSVSYSGTGYGPTATAPTNAGTYTVTATANGNYTGSGSTSITIGKATPIITWNIPSDIVYGTALSGTQLNATANVAGTFVYSPAAGTVLHAGNAQTLSTTFTPTDTTNYNNGSASVKINVTPATLTASANPATPSRAYGTSNPALGVSYTGFVNNDTVASLSPPPTASTTAVGGFAPSGSAPGQYPITVSGGVLSDYTFSYVNGTLTVTKATATVTVTGGTFVYDGNPHAATATTNPAGLTVGFTYNGSGTTPANVNTYAVVGTINDTYYQGTGNATLTITSASQTVTIAPASTSIVVGSSQAFTATGGQNGYNWGGTAPAGTITATSETITFNAVGNYTVTVQSPAGGNYAGSNIATAAVTVTPSSYMLTTSASGPGTISAGGSYTPGVWVGVTATPGTNGKFTGFSGDLTGTTNPQSVQMTQDRNAIATFVAKQPQTITFAPPGNFSITSKGTNLVATASSGLPVTFTVLSGPGQMTSSTYLSFTGTGTIVVQASQAGDANWATATPVSQNVTVLAPPNTSIQFDGNTQLTNKEHNDSNYVSPVKN